MQLKGNYVNNILDGELTKYIVCIRIFTYHLREIESYSHLCIMLNN